jgi:hypothetical protein
LLGVFSPEGGRANLIYFHEAANGGHFAAWEHPAVFAAELREGFKSLRSATAEPTTRHPIGSEGPDIGMTH